MARPASGQVVEREGKDDPSFAIRFTTAAGERRQVRRGRASEGWTRRRADEELQALLADLPREIENPLAVTPKEKVREGEKRHTAIDRGRPLKDESGRVLRPLSTTSIDKTITRLAKIVEAAMEYELIDRDVARARRRKLEQTKYRGTFLDGVDQIVALLDAAGEMDADTRRSRR
jgi:hypothetical protein